jgi:GTP-binding protein YchF
MSLSIAIVGLPNVGKSTLFNALTGGNILAANYPFATIEPNSGIVPVPDPRLDVLAKMYQTNKVIPATVEFVDVAGLVEGASKGQGLGNKFLANIRECDAICHVVRAFDGDKVLRQTGRPELDAAPDPAADIDIIRTELMLADIATIENHLPKVAKEAKSNPKMRARVDYLTSLQNELLTGKVPDEFNQELLSDLNLLTAKPTIYLFNVDENGLTDKEKQAELRGIINVAQSNAIFICAELESQLRELPAVEAVELLADYGVEESGLSQLARAAYDTLGLQSYLTAGPKEVRAWTIRVGATAPQAAGVIHTDFETGFIAAQVVDYNDLIAAGSETEARKLGKIRTEGKTYIMRPGDIVEFRFNV